MKPPIHEAWKIEGDIFKLYRKGDKCQNLNEFVKIQKEIWELTVKREKILNDLNDEKRNIHEAIG